MIPIVVQTLIVTSAPGPSALVLRPLEDSISDGKYRVVPIWVGVAEATQLSIALEHTKMTRPMTHDLFLDAITNLDARIDHVLINDVQGAMFFSKLFLSQHGRIVELDARPSDAVSLALRQDAPLFIEESVLERASYPYIVRNKTGLPVTQQELAEFHSFISNISPDDFSA